MKKYRAYSDPKGSDQIIFEAKDYDRAKKIAKPLMKKPDRMKVYCQTIKK